jgi:hypothetical protein
MALEAAYFNPHDNRPWHYAIFVHNAGVPNTFPEGSACPRDPMCFGYIDPTATGFSELPGFNFMVAFGYEFDAGNP